MKPIFIELTLMNGNKFLANIAKIEKVVENKETNRVSITGLNNNGGFEIKETYTQVKNLIANAVN